MALFKRRHRPSMWKMFKIWIMPDRGWGRRIKYFLYRVMRLSGTPHSIALGFSFGVAISFTPLIGFHLMGAGLLAWLARSNILAAFLGTLVGNPWTLPVMFWMSYKTGKEIMDYNMAHHVQELSSEAFEHHGVTETILKDFLGVFYPMLVGSVPMFLMALSVSYVVMRPLVRRLQRIRHERRHHHRHRRHHHAHGTHRKQSE